MAALNAANEARGTALNGIATRLAQPFAAGNIAIDLATLQPLEDNDAGRQAMPCNAGSIDQGDGAIGVAVLSELETDAYCVNRRACDGVCCANFFAPSTSDEP